MSDNADTKVQRSEQTPKRHLSSSVLWGLCGLVLALGVSMGVLALRGGGLSGLSTREMLRPFGEVPDFALLERSGQPVTKAALLGKVWIVDFIFTQCVDVCPLASSRMAELQEAFASEEDVRLVSITVDPVHDTAEVLTQYAERLGAHPERWLFLTGDKARIYRLAQEGFHLAVFDPNEASQSSTRPSLSRVWRTAHRVLQVLEPTTAMAHHGAHRNDDTNAIQHSPRFVLVDRQGQIRQYYDSKDEDVVRRVQKHVKLLLQAQ